VAHLPDFLTLDGIIDVYYVITILEMADILHPATYTAEGVPGRERLDQIQGRRDACRVRELLWDLFEFDMSLCKNKSQVDLSLEDLFWECMAHQLATLHTAASILEDKGIFCVTGRKISKTMMKILKVHFVPGTHAEKAFWNAWAGIECYDRPLSFAWQPFNGLNCQAKIKRRKCTYLALSFS
jgi:hypothetical protein